MLKGVAKEGFLLSIIQVIGQERGRDCLLNERLVLIDFLFDKATELILQDAMGDVRNGIGHLLDMIVDGVVIVGSVVDCCKRAEGVAHNAPKNFLLGLGDTSKS